MDTDQLVQELKDSILKTVNDQYNEDKISKCEAADIVRKLLNLNLKDAVELVNNFNYYEPTPTETQGFDVIAELESEISNLETEITELKVSLKYCKETVRMFQCVTNKLIQYKGHVNDQYWKDQGLAYDKQQELSTSIALKNKELKRLKITLDVLKAM